MTQKQAELEVLTLLEAHLLANLPRPRTLEQREAAEFWKLFLQRLREEGMTRRYVALSEFIDSLFNNQIHGLRRWNWESTAVREHYELEHAA